MNSRISMWLPTVYLFTALAIPVWMAAQDNPSQDNKHKHHTYQLVDMGTLGGQQSDIATAYARIINRQGSFIGFGETAFGDPMFPDFSACFSSDCLIGHGFVWQNGVVTDLGALSPTEQSGATWINDSGQISGVSTNGLIDPLLGIREIRAVLWQNGTILNLGTLGGNESLAGSVNNQGQVFGVAANTISDPYSLFGWGTQTRAFLWQNGVMTDLGTLGGPDANGGIVNDRGQMAGCSYTNDIPNPTTGVPTLDPFLWSNGTMRDLGTLGGTSGCATFMNNRGSVVGTSNLSGDTESHAFLWRNGKMTDLGTFGGTSATPNWISETDEVVGRTTFSDGIGHAFRWKNGVLKDLGTLPGDKCSNAWGSNSQGQIVGSSGMCGIAVHGFLWENGDMVDLNSLVPRGVELTYGFFISESGVIAGTGRITGDGNTGLQHSFLLIPNGDCTSDCKGRIVASPDNVAQAQNVVTVKQSNETLVSPLEPFRSRMLQRHDIPGQSVTPRD